MNKTVNIKNFTSDFWIDPKMLQDQLNTIDQLQRYIDERIDNSQWYDNLSNIEALLKRIQNEVEIKLNS